MTVGNGKVSSMKFEYAALYCHGNSFSKAKTRMEVRG